MARISQSQNVDRSQFTPVTPGQNGVTSNALPPSSPTSVFMEGSLPEIASSSDLYTRQFHGRGHGTAIRFLPVNLK